MWCTPTMGLSIILAIALAACDPQLRQPYMPGPAKHINEKRRGMSKGREKRTLGECIRIDFLWTQLGFPQRRPNRQRLPHHRHPQRNDLPDARQDRRTIFLACASWLFIGCIPPNFSTRQSD